MLRSPFAALQTSAGARPERGASMSGMWTGRVVFSHRDERGRLKFLFDVIPLTGWPAASEDVAGATTNGRGPGLRGVARVRLRQAFVGNLRNLGASPTGIIVVPEIGSVVSVEMDEAGWIITGFHSGPIIAADGSVAALAEASYNPGLEEAQPSINDNTRIPWMFGIEEGDIILGRGDSRLKLRREGVFIGSGVQCLHLYNADTGQLFERYVQFERRAVGRLSYHKVLLGVNAAVPKNPIIQLPTDDALVVNTDIIESSPYLEANDPYIIRQRGHVTRSTIDLGRMAGEVLPMPTEISTETDEGIFTVMRDTVVQPTVAPTGTNADVAEMQTTSRPVFDHQVGADGSFHFRAGNLAEIPGASHLGESSQLDFELSFDATTQEFDLRVGRGGNEVVSLTFNGLTGNAAIKAENVLRLKASQVIIEADASISMSTPGPITFTGANAKLDNTGTLKVLQDVLAGVAQIISLNKHQHPYTDNGSPVITAPPIP